eukprot:GSChrysophyteH1.ASY1.ANO1.2620.1 assembled CDS
MYDRHGSVDVLLDADWLNLVLSSHASGIEAYTDEKKLEIMGSSLNALLLGMIIFHGYVKPTPQELFGGTNVWDHTMEHVLVMLPHIATIPEVMVRIIYILQGFLMEISAAEEELQKAHMSARDKHLRHPTDLSNMWYGAVNFLKYWIGSYNEYFSDLQLREFEQAVRDMCTRLQAKERVKVLPYLDNEIDRTQRNVALIDLTAHLCLRLHYQVSDIARARSWASLGFSHPAVPAHISSRANVGIALPFSNLAPSLPQLEGNWRGISKEKTKRAYRDAVNSVSTSNMGVFGGAANLENFDESSDSENEEADPNDQTQSDLARLEVRVPRGFSLTGKDRLEIWSLDTLELARQMTLSDQKLFQAIPPHNLLNCSWNDPRFTLAAPNIRRFIDRFNAMSSWVTSSVLNGNTPEKRAFIYEYLIQLGQHFRNLHNFHSLMALLTGLQRGAITRLSATMALVANSEKKVLQHLLDDMNGGKNYIKYRSILERFVHHKKSVGAFIPHLGAHLAEITSIDEGNPDYLNDAPHLINVSKIKLSARAFSRLADLQRFKYNLTPVRLIACAIDKALQPYVLLTQEDVAAQDKKVYALSLEREQVQVKVPQTEPGSESGGDESDGSYSSYSSSGSESN